MRRVHAEAAELGDTAPGTVLAVDDDNIAVATANGKLVLTQIQLAGGKPLTAREFLNGHDLAVDDRLL